MFMYHLEGVSNEYRVKNQSPLVEISNFGRIGRRNHATLGWQAYFATCPFAAHASDPYLSISPFEIRRNRCALIPEKFCAVVSASRIAALHVAR
jgi:hypothetical protein